MTRSEAFQVAKPILFNTEMVRAIQDGRKTATRRVMKPQPDGVGQSGNVRVIRGCPPPPYEAGDILYVRETWAYRYCWECEQQGVADECELKSQKFKNAPFGECGCYKFRDEDDEPVDHQWHSAASMPKEAARIFLRVTGVRVERLQDIITGDYKTPLNINCEGLISPCCKCIHHNGDCKDFIANNTCRLVDSYIDLWNSTIKESDIEKYGWEANPWVWVIEFERLEVDSNA